MIKSARESLSHAIDDIASELEIKDFVRKSKKANVLLRARDYKIDSIRFLPRVVAGELAVPVALAIRFHNVEELAHELGVVDSNDTSTIGIDLGNLAHGKYKLWQFVGLNGDQKAVEAITSDLLDHAIRFFDTYESMAPAYEHLLDEIRGDSTKNKNYTLGARSAHMVKKALIMGKLMDDPQIPEAIEICRRHVESVSESRAQDFDAFLKRFVESN